MTEAKTIHEERAKSAREATGRAREELRSLEEQRPLLSVAAFEGDQEAKEQLEALDVEISEKRREAEIALTTAGEAGRVAADLRRLEDEEQAREEAAAKRGHYDELASRREDLETQAQETLDNLLQHLDDLAKLDGEQRAAARAAGVDGVTNRILWSQVTNGWLAAHLKRHAPELDARPDLRKPLVEIDTLPRRAMAPVEIEALQATRAEEIEARKSAEDRRLDAIEWTQAIDNRRRALLAQTTHESSPPAIQRDIERQVEADLRREFPGYTPRHEPGAQPGA